MAGVSSACRDRDAGLQLSGLAGTAAPAATGRVAHATLFPPRPKSRRRTLPAVHREVALWLRHQAVLWWVTTDRFMELCSYRI